MKKFLWLLAILLLVGQIDGQSRTSGRSAPGFLSSIKHYIESIRFVSIHIDSLTVSDSTTFIIADDMDLTGHYLLDAQNITDQQGTHLWFDGVDDTLLIGNDGKLLDVFDENGGAIEIVFRPRNDGSSDTAYVWEMSGSLIGVTGESSGKMKLRMIYDFSTTNGQWTSTNTEVVTDDWNHVLIGYDADATTNDPVFYVNADTVAKTEDATPVGTRGTDASADITVSSDAASGYPYDGDISLLRYWNYVPSADDVKALYSGSPIPYKYYGADNTLLTDSSAAGNDTVAVTVGKRYHWVKGNADTLVSHELGADTDLSTASTYTFTATSDSIVIDATDMTGCELYQIGVVLEYTGQGINDAENKWYSSGTDGIHAAMDEALVVAALNNIYLNAEEPVSDDKLASINKTVSGSRTEVWVADEDGDVVQTGNLTIGSDKSIFSSALDITINPAEGGHVIILGDTLLITDGGADSTLIWDSGTYFTVESDNDIAVNAASNTKMTAGITLRQGALDDDILTFQSTDVDHSMDQSDSSTYASFSKAGATTGGALIVGFTDGDALPMGITGTFGTNNPTDATPAISMVGQKTQADFTGVEVMGNDEKVFDVRNYDTSKLSVLGEGDLIVHSGDGTESSKMTLGVIVKQGAADDEAIVLQSTDVDHTTTSVADTSTYFRVQKLSATGGGAVITGISDTDAEGLALDGIINAADPTDTKEAVGIHGYKISGANVANLGADETILAVDNNATKRLAILGDGDMQFQQASTISTSTGHLTLDPGIDVVINTGDTLVTDVITINTDAIADGAYGANIGSPSAEFNLGYYDTLHANVFENQGVDFALGTAGFDISMNADSLKNAYVQVGNVEIVGDLDADTVIVDETILPDADGGATAGATSLRFNYIWADTSIANVFTNASDMTLSESGSDITFNADTLKGDLVWQADVEMVGDLDVDTLIVDGAIGIGTSSPDYLLDVEGATSRIGISATSGSPELIFRESATVRANIFYDITNNAFVFRNAETKTFRWDDGSIELMRIHSDGNVGIGTSSPWHDLAFYSATPWLALTDTDVNITVSSAAQAIDTNAIFIEADGTPSLGLRGSDGDAYEITINTSDQALFQNASGGYVFDTIILPDADDGANIGASATRFNLIWADTVHASVYDGTDMVIGASGSDVTFNSDTLNFGASLEMNVNGTYLSDAELAYIDGQDQAVGSNDSPTFDDVTIDTLILGASSEILANATYLSMTEIAYLDGQDQAVGSNDSPTFATPVVTAIDGGTSLGNTGTFAGAATVDTVVVSGFASTDFFVVAIHDATPVADDLLSWTSTTDTLFVYRVAGTTANLGYSYIRVK